MPRRATYRIVQPSQELASYVKKARCCLHRVWALNSSHKDWFRETLSGTARTRVAGWEWLVGRTAQAWGEHHEYGPSQCLSLLCNRLFSRQPATKIATISGRRGGGGSRRLQSLSAVAVPAS